MNIYLIGMPGSGKSTIGKELALKLNKKFIDLDEYIEQKSFMFISEIFEAYGEKFFRDLETNCLKELKESTDLVVACGGGIILKSENKDEMNGAIVYLSTTIEELKRRCEGTSDTRPLLKTKTIEELFLERENKYLSFADIVCDSTNECVEELIEMVDEYEKGINY